MKEPFSSLWHIWTDYRVGRAIRKQKEERSEELNAIQVSEEKEKVVEEQPDSSPRSGCEEEEVVEEHPVRKSTTERSPPPECEEKNITEEHHPVPKPTTGLPIPDCEAEVVEEHPLRTPTTEPPSPPPLASPLPPGPAPAPASAPPEPTTSPSPSPSPLRRTWLEKHNSGWHLDKNPQDEFPWSYRQVVDEESNWRGTWTLEVRDMRAMDWGIERVPKDEEEEGSKGEGKGKGRGGKYVRRRMRQFPFGMAQRTLAVAVDVDAEGGQDDLMVWLGKK